MLNPFKLLVFIGFCYQINGYFLSILSLHFFTFLKKTLFFHRMGWFVQLPLLWYFHASTYIAMPIMHMQLSF